MGVDARRRKKGYAFAMGRPRFRLSTLLPALENIKPEIESEIGEPVLWNPNPDNRDKIVAIYRDANLEDRNSWPAHLDWMVSRVTRFREAFSTRVKTLKPPSAD